MTRNPLIFGLFTRMHLVERVASGIPRMQEAMREANLPEPEFQTEGMFTVVFKRGIDVYKRQELQFYAIRKRATEAGLHVSEYVRQAVVSAEVTPRPLRSASAMN